MARIITNVKDKGRLAFYAGDDIRVYEAGFVETGPYAGFERFAAYSPLQGRMARLQKWDFAYWVAPAPVS